MYKGLWRGTVVAVKTMVLPANMSGQEKREKMAIMEAAISSSLAHPNIVQVRSSCCLCPCLYVLIFGFLAVVSLTPHAWHFLLLPFLLLLLLLRLSLLLRVSQDV